MLIYHFGSKDGLIAALLRHLADLMKLGLGDALPPGPFATEAELLRILVGLMRSAPFRPYARVWFDILSAAAQGRTAHRAAGQEMLGLYCAWIAELHPEGAAAAPRLLALLEGILVLDALDQGGLADAALAAAGA
jgi:AcrR family transcriptional regulator